MLKRIIDLIRKIPLQVYKLIDAVGYARFIGVRVGKGCRFLRTEFGTEPYLITIGDHVTLTDVLCVTHDGGVWVFRDKIPDIELFGPIRIGNNVFVGAGTIILPNVVIGDNCVIGAGSVVAKSIPDNSVAVGIPAKVIKSTEQYYESIKDRCTHIRSYSPSSKKKYLIDKYDIE